MTREQAVAFMVGAFITILAAGLSALGWYINRRVAAWTSVQARLAAIESKLDLVDVSGTHGNRTAIDQLRRDLEGLEDLHRRDLADVAAKHGTMALGVAQLAERLNSYTWGRRAQSELEAPSRPPSGRT